MAKYNTKWETNYKWWFYVFRKYEASTSKSNIEKKSILLTNFFFPNQTFCQKQRAKNVHWKWIAIIPIQSLLLHHIILSAVSNFVLQNLKITFFGAKNGDDKRELYLYVFMCKEMTRKTWGSDGLLVELLIIIII